MVENEIKVPEFFVIPCLPLKLVETRRCAIFEGWSRHQYRTAIGEFEWSAGGATFQKPRREKKKPLGGGQSCNVGGQTNNRPTGGEPKEKSRKRTGRIKKKKALGVVKSVE